MSGNELVDTVWESIYLNVAEEKDLQVTST